VKIVTELIARKDATVIAIMNQEAKEGILKIDHDSERATQLSIC